jgi:hypothetical protein
MLSKTIVTADGEYIFELRLFKEEGAGLLTTRSDRSYLLLDSLDYWYDLTQTGYPKKRKCTCKSEWFGVQFDYTLRADEQDIQNVQIITTCTRCGKLSKAMSVEFKYSPTLHFLTEPISRCEKPKIKYKYKQLNCYWKYDDLKLFLTFMATELKLVIYCHYAKYPENTDHFEQVSLEKAIAITTVNHRYFDFYLARQETGELGRLIEGFTGSESFPGELWRKHELIHLSMPFSIVGYGTLYYIHYCAEYLDKGHVTPKSAAFEQTTHALEAWVKKTFVTGRGKNAFDGHEAHKQVMAKLKPN